MKRRLFVAVALDDGARASCARVAQRLRTKGWDARWVAPENYHLTAAFLGAVDADRVDAVLATVRDAATGIAPFAVPLDAVGAFPNVRKPRVAWVGPARAVPAYGTLCGVVRSALAAHGFTFDGRADAHVTLARADAAHALPAVPPPVGVQVSVDAVTVYESFPHASGARYVALERTALAG